MLENLIVALIVALALLVACVKVLPASWRRRAVFALGGGAARQGRMARWFGTESSCASGCETCQACADPADPAAPADGPDAARAPAPDAGPARRVIKLHLQT
ncbi:MAG: DUF6587 family protein [Pseudomonadota bacterium]